MKACLVVNPAAGNRPHRTAKRIEALLRKQVFLQSFTTGKKGDALSFARELKDTDRIIVAGGDGTVNEVMNGLLSSGNDETRNIPLAIIPSGTANVMAAELGIPKDIESAVELSLGGTARKISVGRINGRYFSLMAGIGFDAETVLGVKDGPLKRISGKGAYIFSGISALRKYPPPLIKLRTPECEFTGYTAVISNVRSYGGDIRIAPGASVTEPMLDICIFKGSTRKDLLRYIYGIVRGKHLEYSDVVYIKSTGVDVSSEGEVHVQVDGDYYGKLPARIDIVSDALSLVW